MFEGLKPGGAASAKITKTRHAGIVEFSLELVGAALYSEARTLSFSR
jgi:hypothetical protein